jgi:hypothetical protein
MANTRAANVMCIDTDADFTGPLLIEGIRFVPAGVSPSVTIKQDSSSGDKLYENSNSDAEFNEVCIRASTGISVALTGTGSKVYIYLSSK